VTALGTDEHPAVQAWRELGARPPRSVAVELRKKHKKSRVYRLRGAGPRGATVVAKYCLSETAAVERLIYEEILPQLRMSALRCYGSVTRTDGGCWLFLEDAGEGRVSFEDPAHRRLVARWVARLHVEAAELPELDRLPDRGAAHYFALLRAGRREISASLRNRALTAEHLLALRRLASLYERLAAHWASVSAFSSALTPTLVHGDIRRTNVRRRGQRVLALDWEMAGRGIPAVDVVKVDVETYVDEARADRDTAVRLQALGGILRNLDAVDWISPQLSQPWGHIDLMQAYADGLGGAMNVFFAEDGTLD